MRSLLVTPPLQAGEVLIMGDEAHHGRAVLRLRPGRRLRLCDGAGAQAEAEVIEIGRDRIRCRAGVVTYPPSPPVAQLELLVAMPRPALFDDLVRGLTELGVGTIRPLVCERALRAPQLDRARRVAAEACKQCRRVRLPVLGPLVDFATLASWPRPLILLDQDGAPADPGHPRPTTLLIGPEGGFSEGERAALRSWATAVQRLAGHVLRIETCALAAAAVWACHWERPLTS